MPTYEFECDKCGFQFEKQCRMGQTRGVSCPGCTTKKVTKVMSAFFAFSSGNGGSSFDTGSSKCQTCASGTCSTCR